MSSTPLAIRFSAEITLQTIATIVKRYTRIPRDPKIVVTTDQE